MRDHTKNIIIMIFGGLIGFLAGYMLGVLFTLNWGADFFFRLLENQKIIIDLNKQQIVEGAWRYKNMIG